MSARPRLLVITSTYPRWRDDPEPGFVHELSKRLVGQFDVSVIAPHAAGALTEETMDGVNIYRYRYAPVRWETLVNDGGIINNLNSNPAKWLLVPLFLFAQAWVAWRLIRRWHPDVIHAHWLIPQGLLVTLLRHVSRHAPPFVVTSHGADLFALRGRLARKLKRWVADSSAAMSVVSSAMREEVERNGFSPPRLIVLPMGVDLKHRFVPDPQRPRSTDQLLFVGRLVAKKGLSHLLDALPKVLERRPGVTLKIVGFGPEEAALKHQAQKLGIAEHVIFAGAVPQYALPDLYRHAAVVVAPFIRDASGDQEGLPVALMEAIGCGCPVVVGEVAGIHDLLGEMAQSSCVNPKDPDMLSDAIISNLEDPSQAVARALMIRRAALARIDWQVIAEGYGELLKSCVEGTTDTRSAA